MRRHRLSLLGCCSLLLAGTVLLTGSASAQTLVSWVGDGDRRDSDFLAVIDADPGSASYGEVLSTLPIDAVASHPHHTEHAYAHGRSLFAAGFGGNRLFRFDLTDPRAPGFLGPIELPKELAYPHSFARLPDGRVVVTMQGHNPADDAPGGIAIFADDGTLIRSASADDAAFDNERPYGVVVLPEHDRLITASGLMPLPFWHEQSGRFSADDVASHIQLWRLSDLELLETSELKSPAGLDAHRLPYEPRVLSDGRTVLLSTALCGLYLVRGLEESRFGADLVYRFDGRGCAVPVVIDRFWIQSVTSTREVIVLDVSNPRIPREMSRFQFPEGQTTHWLAYNPTADADGHRIVVVNDESGEARMWMLQFDPETGRLELDQSFRDPGSSEPGVSFERTAWPHGETGPAFPHGTVFAP